MKIEILGLGEYDVDVSEYLTETLNCGGYVNAEFYRQHSIYMKKSNPMHRDEVVAKRSETLTGKPGRKLYEWEKKALSKRMTENNPTKINPACTNTAKPVEIYYEDGTIEKYEYLKEATKLKGIPYATLQRCLYKNKPSKKWKIKRIKQCHA